MRRLVLVTAVMALGLFAVSACGLVFDIEALGPGAGDATTDPEIAREVDGDSDGGGEASGPCPSNHGPPMVLAAGHCIDATEVTVAEYAPFIETARSVLPLPEPCEWVTTFAPTDFAKQRATPTNPVVNVNYCHAFQYCRWAGKHLCGRAGGGPVAPGDAGLDPKTNEWLRACTHEGEQRYSYGKDLAVGACPTTVGPVKSRGACAGPYPGLYDMLGNAYEWIDGCTEENLGHEHDPCVAAGQDHVRDEGNCYEHDELSRYSLSPYLGFRCCGE